MGRVLCSTFGRRGCFLDVFAAPWVDAIPDCAAAIAMDPDSFGGHTESVRELAFQAIIEAQRGAAALEQAGSRSAAPPVCFSVATTGVPPASRAGGILVVANGNRVASAAAGSLEAVSASLQCETDEAARLARELIEITPHELLFGKASAVPLEQRRASRIAHLAGMGCDSLRSGVGTVRAWLDFCRTHSLSTYGVPVDEDMMDWFLTWDESRAMANATGKRTGKHVKYARACSCRWLSDNAGLPFGAAKSQAVRKKATQNLSTEPAFAEMWEVAILVHLVRIVVFYTGPHADLIVPYAMGGYLVAAASLRLIDGQRSPPATVGHSAAGPVVESVASLSERQEENDHASSALVGANGVARPVSQRCAAAGGAGGRDGDDASWLREHVPAAGLGAGQASLPRAGGWIWRCAGAIDASKAAVGVCFPLYVRSARLL